MPTKTFTYIGDLSTNLDYARTRLDDIDPQASVDETKAPSPFLWDETYAALINKFGIQQGMVLAARMIAARLSKDISSFGEAAGIRVSWKDKAYYEQLAKEIAKEPPFVVGGAVVQSAVKTGKIKRGDGASFQRYIDEPPSYPLYDESTLVSPEDCDS